MMPDDDPLIAAGFPLPRPEPPADCDFCGSLARQRAAAGEAGDLSRVSDCNVKMRNHHGTARRRQ